MNKGASSIHTKLQKGMSLIELVVALALIAISITGVMGVIIQSTDLGQSTDNAYVALNIARNRIERAREIRDNKGYANLPDMVESIVDVDRHGEVAVGGGTDFRRTTTVNTDFADNLTEITVSVEYKSKGLFVPAPVELVTVLSSINY